MTLIGLAVVLGGCGQNNPSSQSLKPDQKPQSAAVILQRDDPSDQPLANPAKLQEDAIAALEAGDLEAAFKLVRAARSATPKDPEVIFLLARVLAEGNRFAEAIKLLDDLAEAMPAGRLPVLGQTAEWLVFDGQGQEAEKRYRILLEETAGESMVHRQLSQLLLRQGRRLEAATHLRVLCRAGELNESELRAMLMIVHPFSGTATSDELEPIGELGRARHEIGQGNWDAALAELATSKLSSPLEKSLQGRIYAHQQDFESLAKWVSEVPEGAQETADYWFATGVYHTQQGNHPAAVKAYCSAALLDQTDAEAYAGLSQSLREMGVETAAQEASRRAELIQQTREIGKQLVASTNREDQMLTKLSDLLDELHRPLEALAWRYLQLVYGQSSSAPSNQDAKQAMREINRTRLQRLEANDTEASQEFILCGIDLDSLSPANGQ
jgi:Flp pilus assembly protein TadD